MMNKENKMNAKKAKALRNLVSRMVEKGVITGDAVRYGKVTGNSRTRVLDPQCARGVYRRLKSSGAERVLTGQA